MKNLNLVGKKNTTNEGYEVEIIGYTNNKNVDVIIDNKVIQKTSLQQFEQGKLKNPYHPSVYGVGYFGEGRYKSAIDKIKTPYYMAWKGIMYRCYTDIKPTYKDVIVCKEWHNFQNFAEWFEENNIEGFQLDKDILIKGNKIYSPDTCCFVPNEINLLLTKNNSRRGDCPLGVYRQDNRYISCINKNGKKHFKPTKLQKKNTLKKLLINGEVK